MALDDTITVHNPLVGIAGLVPAGEKVLLSSKIQSPRPLIWNGTASPTVGGHFTGLVDNTYTFTVSTTGEVGITSGLALNWVSATGNSGSVSIGSGYTPPMKLPLQQGIQIGINSGSVSNGDSFAVTALSPRDVFSYTINQEPYTQPVIVVSYNDPSGNKRFATPVELNNITEDLSPYLGDMNVAPELLLGSGSEFNPDGDNQVTLTFINPRNEPIDGHLVIAYGTSITGTLVAAHVITTTFEPGPNLFVDTWNTSEFSPTYQSDVAYKIKAYATDAQDRTIDVAFSQFANLGSGKFPTIAIGSTEWNVGTVTKGSAQNTTLAIANTGFSDLWIWVGQGAPVSLRAEATVHRLNPGEMKTIPLTLDTSQLEAGAFSNTLIIRSNDPNLSDITFNVNGMIVTPSGAVTPQGDVYEPLAEQISISAAQSANTILNYAPASEIDDNATPMFLLDLDGNVVGRGQQFAPMQMMSGNTELTIDDSNSLLSPVYTQSLSIIRDPEDLPPFINRYDPYTGRDLLTARELPEYHTPYSRSYLWSDGHGVLILSLGTIDGSNAPEDTISTGDRYDAYVNAWYPYTPQPGQTHMYIGYYPTYEKSYTRVYVKFDLPALPAYSVIDSSTFHLHEYSWYGSNTINTQIFRVTSDWSESSAPTWNSQPSIDWGTVWDSRDIPKGYAWRDWDISNLMRAWYSGTPNYGLMLRANPENANGMVFYTRENGSLVPHIYIHYHITPPPTSPVLYSISNPESDGTFTVDWSDVASITGYELQEKLNNGSWNTIYSSIDSTYNVSGRSAGLWCYQVRALNTAGSSAWSTQQCTTVNTTPNPPINLTPTHNSGHLGRAVLLSWQDGGDPDNYPATPRQYQAEIWSVSGGATQTLNWTTSTQWNVVLPDDGNYLWRVKASDSLASSAWTTSQSLTVYSIARTGTDQISLALPEAITEPTNYRVQYGLRANFVSVNTPQTIYLYIPKRLYTSATLDVLVNQSNAANVAFR